MNKKNMIGAIVMVACSIAVIMISACAKPSGTVLTGEGKGFSGGTIKASVTVDDSGKIVALTITDADNTQTPEIGGKAIPTLKEAILAKGSIEDIDTVSGATMTSWGVIDAVTAALESKQ